MVVRSVVVVTGSDPQPATIAALLNTAAVSSILKNPRIIVVSIRQHYCGPVVEDSVVVVVVVTGGGGGGAATVVVVVERSSATPLASR